MKNLFYNSLFFFIFLSCIVVVEEEKIYSEPEKRIIEQKESYPDYLKREFELFDEIHIKSKDGIIDIIAWEKKKIEVLFKPETEENLDISFKEEDKLLNIEAKWEGKNSVHFILFVPSLVYTGVHLGKGRISLEGIEGKNNSELGIGLIELKEARGEIECSVGSGKITGLFEEIVPENLSLKIGTGKIEIFLPENIKDIFLEAQIGTGVINNEFEFEKIEETGFLSQSLKAQTGKGVNKVKILCGTGEIIIK